MGKTAWSPYDLEKQAWEKIFFSTETGYHGGYPVLEDYGYQHGGMTQPAQDVCSGCNHHY
jgi:hypothetical protein